MAAKTSPTSRRGRPRGLNLNTDAIDDLLAVRCVSKGEIAEVAGITTGHLADALYRQKGMSEARIRAIAMRLQCKPGTIAPELTRRFVAVRDGDATEEVA